MSEKKDKIIMWDDINFLMHKPDTKEKIIEDAINLIKRHKEMKNTEWGFTSSYTVYYNHHIDLMFMIGILGLVERIGRLDK